MEAGDMKAMRDALKVIRGMVNEEMKDLKSISDDVRADFISIRGWCDHALAKPPRACDVMSQEDITKVVISGFMKSLGIGQENQIVSQLSEAAISAAIKCAYDTQLVSKGEEGAADAPYNINIEEDKSMSWDGNIFNKYKIEHVDGSPLKGKRYFVLRLDSEDPVEAARVAAAMRAYRGDMRNCDVGTASDQSRRFCAFCRPRTEPCDGCACLEASRNGRCEFVWAQMPYESEEGVAK